jgi:hypothetical protein
VITCFTLPSHICIISYYLHTQPSLLYNAGSGTVVLHISAVASFCKRQPTITMPMYDLNLTGLFITELSNVHVCVLALAHPYLFRNFHTNDPQQTSLHDTFEHASHPDTRSQPAAHFIYPCLHNPVFPCNLTRQSSKERPLPYLHSSVRLIINLIDDQLI